MTVNSSVNVNLLIEHVISKKPNRDNLEPPAPVKMMFGFVNLLFTLILFHNDFEIQLRDTPESTLAVKLWPLLRVQYKACGCADEFTISSMCSKSSQSS